MNAKSIANAAADLADSAAIQIGYLIDATPPDGDVPHPLEAQLQELRTKAEQVECSLRNLLATFP